MFQCKISKQQNIMLTFIVRVIVRFTRHNLRSTFRKVCYLQVFKSKKGSVITRSINIKAGRF